MSLPVARQRAAHSDSTPKDLSQVYADALVFLLGAAGLILFRWYTQLRLEDSLITFRYAIQIAAGEGFVFNPGEHVQGTTTPLFTLLLAGFCRLFGAAHVATYAFGLALTATLGAGWFLLLSLKRWGLAFPTPQAIALLFFWHPSTLWTAAGGMETTMLALWMSLSMFALTTDRGALAGLAGGLLVLTRIDGLVWVGCLALYDLLFNRPRLWRALLVGLLVLAPWFAFSWAYFGHVLPHSLIAKRIVVDANTAGQNWIVFVRPLAAAVPFLTALGLLLYGLGIYALFRRRLWPGLVAAFYPPAYAAFLIAGNAPLFPWYLVPAEWWGLVVGAVGFDWAVRALRERPAAQGLPGLLRAGLLTAFLCGFATVLLFKDRQTAVVHRMDQINEEGLRRKAGEWLRDNTPSSASVAMEAIGYMGFYSQRRVIDLAGLVSPKVVALRRQYPRPADALYATLQTLSPDYLALRSAEWKGNRHYHGGPLFADSVQRAYFERHYQAVAQFSAPLREHWGMRGELTIFRRAEPDAEGDSAQ